MIGYTMSQLHCSCVYIIAAYFALILQVVASSWLQSMGNYLLNWPWGEKRHTVWLRLE